MKTNKTKDEIMQMVRHELHRDIVERYDNPEYWDMEFARRLLREEGITDEKEIEKILKEIIKLDLDDEE